MFVDHAREHAMIMLDANGVILEWSGGAETLLGWTKDEAIGQPAALFFTQEDRDTGAPEGELDTAFTLGRSADVRWHLRKDGSTVFCDGTVNRILDPDSHALLGYGKVMREAYSTRKGSAEPDTAQAEQRSFLAAVLESVENGIVACDKQGRLTFFNDAARAIHGLGEEPLRFDAWAEHYRLYREDGSTLLPLGEIPLYRALCGERVESTPIVVQSSDGQRRHLQVTGRPLRDGAGHILGAVVSMNDVSSMVEAQSARAGMTLETARRHAAEEAQAALRLAQEKLRLATDAARLGVWTWDTERDIGAWENARMYEIFNLPVDVPIVNGAQLMAAYLHPDDADRFRQATDAALHEGTRFSFVGRIYPPPNREPRWIELHGLVQPSAHGESATIIGTAADVTERKQRERLAEDSRLRLNATLAAGQVATWIWDVESDRIVGDSNLCQLFGVPEEMIADAPLSLYTRAIHPDDAEGVAARIRHATETNEPYRAIYRIRHGDGVYRWVNARGQLERDGDGRPSLLAGVLLDITAQKEMEAELRMAEERYRTLITSMDEAFAVVQVLVDEEGVPVDYRFEEVNRAFQQQSGLVDAAGRTIREMVPDIEPRWIALYGRVALTREPVRVEEHSEAMGYWWSVYATPLGAPSERRIAILFTDITASRKAEQDLRQLAADLSETNRRKTEFLATLAHELRNPLAPMRTGVELLRRAGKNAPGDGRVLEMMDRQLKQIVHLIDDLMDLSRITSGKIVLQRECTDLRAAIANAIETASPAVEAAQHELHVDMPERPIRIDADQTRLAQILGNLLTNAIKYTPGGGRISVAAVENGPAAVLSVTDNGVGVPAEEQARVFDMFSQVSRNMGRAQGGLGIGLSLVRTLVEMHDGTISVSSPGVGLGTTFRVELPLSPECASTDAEPASTPPASAPVDTGLRVLVADDNVDAASIMADLLRLAGHTVDHVHNGRDAVDAIVRTRPDMAILDIGMPDLTGYEVARRIRSLAETHSMLLIALTGWGAELDRARSTEAGFDAHLTKPTSFEALSEVIDHFAKSERHARTPVPASPEQSSRGPSGPG